MAMEGGGTGLAEVGDKFHSLQAAINVNAL